MEHPDDDRPFGWGCCDECLRDCEEADYDPQAKISLHAACAGKRARRAFYLACEAHGISDEELELYQVKGMI